ncbi:hypothetical protein HNP71_002633 [Acidocella aromatica]|uniref:SIR2-like domain-containing protein n=1 Tax=Acidocella aromatica TaxID=1303579 RepID=A0A840VRY6_9PROT|nr:hypothetical protein [Acidocella aromatica]
MKQIASYVGVGEDKFNYLAQKVDNDPAALGTSLVEVVHEWAWTSGRNEFPAEYFNSSTDKSVFLKFLVANYLKTFGKISENHELSSEFDLFRKLSPHAVITTNFDELVADMYPHFERVVGEKIIPMSMNITGEIYQIHGTVDEPQSLVLTKEDYERFMKKRRYISSKMMTYFAEYPVFIFGYGLGDANINAIISDLGEALKDSGGFIDNIFYVEWVEDILQQKSLKEEHVVPVDFAGAPALRVRSIVTSDFSWILEALSDLSSPISVNTKVLRHLAARVVELVRVDAPKKEMQIDYRAVENLSDDPEALASVLGITKVANPNITHPYLLSQLAGKVGYKSWNKLTPLMSKANDVVGFDIKSSDNDYHIAIPNGKSTITRKYSEKMLGLLKELKQEKSGGLI